MAQFPPALILAGHLPKEIYIKIISMKCGKTNSDYSGIELGPEPENVPFAPITKIAVETGFIIGTEISKIRLYVTMN